MGDKFLHHILRLLSYTFQSYLHECVLMLHGHLLNAVYVTDTAVFYSQ